MHTKIKPFNEVGSVLLFDMITECPANLFLFVFALFGFGIDCIAVGLDSIRLDWQLQWRSLDISGIERRRLCCSVLFHCAAALCVIWSLCVLIERAADDVQRGLIGAGC